MNRDAIRFFFQVSIRRIFRILTVLASISLWACEKSNIDPTNMAYVPEGNTLIGCRPWGEPDPEPCGSLEPLEELKDFDAFWIDIHEVTNEQFARFLNTLDEDTARTYYVEDPPTNRILTIKIQISMSNDEWVVADEADEHPVVNVTWEGARSYCVALGKRIPTADEWEKAARGTEGNLFPWGDSFAPQECVLNPPASEYRTSEVGTCDFDTSPFGVKDMGGNVREWVKDESVYNAGWRVTMGNSYMALSSDPLFARYSGGPELPAQSSSDTTWGDAVAFKVGFRCVVSVDQNAE